MVLCTNTDDALPMVQCPSYLTEAVLGRYASSEKESNKTNDEKESIPYGSRGVGHLPYWYDMYVIRSQIVS